ncbi:hypothetical protein IAR50_003483 [Cryptococcus sp. DSM 104548]
MSSQKFTQYLLEKYAADFKKATNHPFLEQSGKGTIDTKPLKSWLKQDYLYAYVGYPKFASALLSKLHFPTPLFSHPTPNLSKAFAVLSFSLANAKRETGFFVDTAKQHGLDVFSQEANDGAEEGGKGLLGEYNEVTRAYVDFLQATGALGSVEEGFVVIWTMEIAYLTAWQYAKTFHKDLAAADPASLTQTQQALVKFVDNWTCDEFVEFVEGCAEIVDGAGIEIGSPLAERCEEAFKRCLWLEQRFWPNL